MSKILNNVWSNFMDFVLFCLIFYAGFMTGLYFEQSKHTVNDGRVTRMEDKIRGITGEMESIKTMQRRK